eukprot:2835147-Prymnesium_polylepis.1
MFRPGARLCGARGGGAQDHQLVGECACAGADHGGLGEDDGGGDGGSVWWACCRRTTAATS